MNFWKSVSGTASVTLIGANIGKSMDLLRSNNVDVTNLYILDDLTVQFCSSRKDLEMIKIICKKQGDTVSYRLDNSIYLKGKKFFKRPALMIGIFLLLILTMILPTRILFLDVQGNEHLPAQLILDRAGACGIYVGASRRHVRSEKMKNALLEAMPELKWAGINTSGCTAIISVREREENQNSVLSSAVRSIIAVRDGIITNCTATHGKLICIPGQIVQKGQVLISGYNDLGVCLQVGPAEGEIFAHTNRNLEIIAPSHHMRRTVLSEPVRRVSFIIGKKRINFLKDSGIWDATCGRMYEEYYMTLPGNFRLPICVSVETIISGELKEDEMTASEFETPLNEFAKKSILQQMVAGKILSAKTNMVTEDGYISLNGRYFCEEMIGRGITEEIGEANGKTD